ncbi:HNH endonuclease [Cohnella boryungensis]|uniref:HNH endonuclease n=1 Tax=Cohnella boryungensis TaxID=768479 RepID=A0ABV8SFL7_9BACL
MEGWKLNKGELKITSLTENEIWRYFNVLFSSKSKNQTSYKYGFIRSLLENLYNTDSDMYLDFDQIYGSFTRIYWNLVVRFALKQTDNSHSQSLIEKVLVTIKDKNKIPDGISFDALPLHVQQEAYKKAKAAGTRYVVGAVYGDTEGQFFGFDKNKEYMQFNPVVLTFMQTHQQVLFRLTNYELIKFLQRNNSSDSCANLIKNVENISLRSLLNIYRQMLVQYGSHHCFYCNKQFTPNTVVEVDHFIPWSFIHNDQLWNLVLACRTCNNSKSNKIADTLYLEKIIDRNQLLIENDYNFDEEMKTYTAEKLKELHKYVVVNGYQHGWLPT